MQQKPPCIRILDLTFSDSNISIFSDKSVEKILLHLKQNFKGSFFLKDIFEFITWDKFRNIGLKVPSFLRRKFLILGLCNFFSFFILGTVSEKNPVNANVEACDVEKH